MKHNNEYLARRDAIIHRECKRYEAGAIQFTFDAACLAAHDVFKMGPVRGERFYNALNDRLNQMADALYSDMDSNKLRNTVYARAKIDEELKAIFKPELFKEWGERYADTPMEILKNKKEGINNNG